jgi:hypothetical protein
MLETAVISAAVGVAAAVEVVPELLRKRSE